MLRRRRLPWLWLTVAVALGLVVATGVALSLASPSSTAGGRPRAPAAVIAAPLRRAMSKRAGPTVNASVLAVDRVLAYTQFIRGGVPRQRVIALTFDDGPSPYTPRIIRVLERLRVPATFFVIGQQLRYFAAGVRAELRGGFVIGDHTENHLPLNVLSERLQFRQVASLARQLRRLGAPFPRLFRPPYGVYDARTLGVLRGLRMLMVLWSVDPRDWLRPRAAEIVNRVLEAARPGAIVELHDGGGDRSQTLAALPAIIAGLRRRHYQLVTVPELLAADPPPRTQRLPRLAE